MSWSKVLNGMLGAAINSAVNAVAAVAIDPVAFNFSDGLANLGKLAAVSAFIGAVLWLKTHPLPEE